MSTFAKADPSTVASPCLAPLIVLLPPVAQALCDAAGVIVAMLPAQQPLVETALSYLLMGGTIRRRQRCHCRRTFCLHDAARLLLSWQTGLRK